MDREAVVSEIDKLSHLAQTAETVGADLHIRTSAIADLFSNCVDCLERVDWDRNPSHSYETLGLQAAGQECCYLRNGWAQEEKEVAQSLIGIKGALHKLCLFGHTSSPAVGRYELGPDCIDAPEGIYSSLPDIKRAFQLATKDRPQEPLLKSWNKVCWVPRDQIELDTLIDNLATYVNRLERVSGRLHVLALQRDLL